MCASRASLRQRDNICSESWLTGSEFARLYTSWAETSRAKRNLVSQNHEKFNFRPKLNFCEPLSKLITPKKEQQGSPAIPLFTTTI